MGHRPSRQVGRSPFLASELLASPEIRAALAAHDIGALFRVLGKHGWTQRAIARATGMPQSSVCEIVKGRQVIGYRVLVRIADGLGIPRELMRLGPDEGCAYAGGGTVSEFGEEVSAEMRRRALLAAAGIAILGRPLQGIGELAKLPGLAPVPLPQRLSPVHVEQVRDLTQRLREAGRAYGSDPQVSSAAVAWATQLLDITSAGPVKRALVTAVAGLHIHAGWAAFDAGLYDRTMHHYTRAVELATEVGDAYLQAIALSYAGLATEENGHPNDGLKMLQLGQLIAMDIPSDDQRMSVVGVGTKAAVQACARADAATALARLGHPRAADTQLAKARDLWQPGPADQNGDLDQVAARLEVERGRLDVAEPFAAASLRRWERGTSKRARIHAGIRLATIHIQACEPSGVRLAHSAITEAAKLTSARARRQLDPLVTALEAWPGSDHRELARMARHVATA